jgi:hypothetical protein
MSITILIFFPFMHNHKFFIAFLPFYAIIYPLQTEYLHFSLSPDEDATSAQTQPQVLKVWVWALFLREDAE